MKKTLYKKNTIGYDQEQSIILTVEKNVSQILSFGLVLYKI